MSVIEPKPGRINQYCPIIGVTGLIKHWFGIISNITTYNAYLWKKINDEDDYPNFYAHSA